MILRGSNPDVYVTGRDEFRGSQGLLTTDLSKTYVAALKQLISYMWKTRDFKFRYFASGCNVRSHLKGITAQCEFLQCAVLGKHGAVSDDVTLRGRGVIFFLKQAKIILRCRYAPGMPRPGVSK